MVIVKLTNILSNLPNNFTGINYSFYKCFVKNKKIHRYYGSAVIYNNGEKSWWFNNKTYGWSNFLKYNQKQFIKDLNKDLNKKWLS